MVRGGGFAGLVSTVSVDSEELAPGDAEALRTKVEEAGVFELSPQSEEGTAYPDAFHYEITVEEGDRRQSVVLREETLPEKARSLISWLDSIPASEQRVHPAGEE